MFQYRYKDKQVISQVPLTDKAYEDLESLKLERTYYFYEGENPEGFHLIDDLAFLKDHSRSLKRLLSESQGEGLVGDLIKNELLIGVNQKRVSIEDLKPLKTGYRVNVLGLGDVGGMMLSAMRLLGGQTISEIGIFDLDSNKMQRWLYELNQIRTIDRSGFPPVKSTTFEEIFDCDAFVFTASSAIPEVGSEVKDVRMYQLEANARIIKIYAEKAAAVGFKGQFIVVSDPVDLLCKAVLDYGDGNLRPEQIKGFGLGVMHARASYYADEIGLSTYQQEGRVFGPHGQHLIVADSIAEYNEEQSLQLTDLTIKANLAVREVGYKPFIAPALSSAALSILAYLEGKPHHSTVYVEGTFFGCRNQAQTLDVCAVEKYQLPGPLMKRLEKTYEELRRFEF